MSVLTKRISALLARFAAEQKQRKQTFHAGQRSATKSNLSGARISMPLPPCNVYL